MVAPVKYPLVIEGLQPDDLKYENPQSKWARIACHWKERVRPGSEAYMELTYYATINCQTEKIYMSSDFKKAEITMKEERTVLTGKFAALVFGTPGFFIAKTIYHLLFPLSLGHQIYQAVKEDRKLKAEATKNGEKTHNNLALRIVRIVLRNFVDIVRTPIYAVAMTITALASVIFSPFHSEVVNHGRVVYGSLLISLNWGNKNTVWTNAPCMQPLGSLKDDEEKKFYVKTDTVYDGDPGTKIHALNNLARRHLSYREKPPACSEEALTS